MSLYDDWRGRAPEDDGPPETPFREVADSTPAECVWCRKWFDVAGYSESAERGEFSCARCSYVIGEVGLGRMCAVCEKPKDRGEECCP